MNTIEKIALYLMLIVSITLFVKSAMSAGKLDAQYDNIYARLAGMEYRIVEVNITRTETIASNCPALPSVVCNCAQAEVNNTKSAYTIHGGWINNTWWHNQSCTGGYNCSTMG